MRAGNLFPFVQKHGFVFKDICVLTRRPGRFQVDSPTVERVSPMLFLHMCVSYGWTKNWFIGDISNAFLQGAPLQGKEAMYMRPPKQGLKGVWA